MNTILVQSCNTKFMRSIEFLSFENTYIAGSVINNNLYQLFYSIKPTHAIFYAHMLTKEIVQFIQDFSLNVQCYLYHDTVSEEALKLLEPYNVTHITHTEEYQKSLRLPNNLINTKLFYNDQNITKRDSIVCFIDHLPILPDFIKNFLYPKSKLPIKLFNNPYIQHHQNLGLLNEKDKATVLQHNKYYLIINDNDQYIEEAKHCGCTIVNINDIEKYESLEYTKPSSFSDLSEFLKENIL